MRFKVQNVLYRMTYLVHTVFMVRHINKTEFVAWKNRVGREVAIFRIMAIIGCKRSKAQKIADGTYPSLPAPLELKALALELGKDIDILFKPVGSSRKRTSY